ncbi:type II toxin-antitoxin system prevent-host-death family antitoxin [Streptomyces sp. CA-100214]
MYTKAIEAVMYMRGGKYTAAMAPMTEHTERIADVRNSFADAVGRARYSDEPTILTNRGKRVAAVVSMDLYDWTREVAALLVEAADDPDKSQALQSAGIDLMATLPNGKVLVAQAKNYRAASTN